MHERKTRGIELTTQRELLNPYIHANVNYSKLRININFSKSFQTNEKLMYSLLNEESKQICQTNALCIASKPHYESHDRRNINQTVKFIAKKHCEI